MDRHGAGLGEQAEVGGVESTLGADDHGDLCRQCLHCSRDRNGVLPQHAREDRGAGWEGVQRGAEREDGMHLGRGGAAGELCGFSRDEPPAVETVHDPRRIGTRDRAMGQDRPNRRRTRFRERFNGRIHRLRRDRLQHVHGEARFAARGSAPHDRPADARGRDLVQQQSVLDGTALDDHDRLAWEGAQRAREMLRIRPRQRRAATINLVGFHEEARHGSVHGAALASRYGGDMSEVHLTARLGGGVALSVVITGDGDPLLLIPGLGAGRSAFDPILADLARGHRVISFDPRGIGESTGGGHETLTAMALDAVAVLEAVEVASAAVFGVSMGGLVAQHLVVDHPDRVTSLILAATAPGGYSGVDANRADRAALMGKGTRTPEDAYRMACTVLYSPQFQRTHTDFIEAQIGARALHPVRPRVFSAQFKAMWEPDDTFERLPSVTAPTLVLHGTDDVVTPFENARILARQIPGAVLRPFDGCGHLFFHERPAETARVVTEHVRAVRVDAGQSSSADGSSSPAGVSSDTGS